jgi:polygalacturonase
MHNITYRNCTVTGALAGIRFKFRPTQAGFVQDVLFEDIVIQDPVAYAVDVLVTADHTKQQQHATELGIGEGTVNVTDITLRNIRDELGIIPSGQ